jgi:hypothetical protein
MTIITKKNRSMKVTFLSRTKQYGKWQRIELDITEPEKLENIPNACSEYAKSILNSERVEVQSIEKVKKKST